jgi:hypothetical protein
VPIEHASKEHGPPHEAWVPLAWVGVVKVPSSATVHIEMEEQSTTICDHTTTAAILDHPSSYGASENTQVCKGKIHQSLAHIYLQINRVWSCKNHVSFVYVHMLWFGYFHMVHP